MKWAIAFLAFILFIRYYHIIRLLWVWYRIGEYTVRVYKYTRMGTRSIVWENEYATRSSARSAGQGVMIYLDGKDKEHAYTFTVYQTSQLPIGETWNPEGV